jgi:hypothetical protein
MSMHTEMPAEKSEAELAELDRPRRRGPLRPLRGVLSRRSWLWLSLLAVVAIAVAAVGIPVWGLRPFEPQSAAVLARAYAVRRAAPAATLLALAAAAALAWRLWRPAGSAAYPPGRGGRIARWAGRLALAAALLATGAAAWFARQNIFEKMFPPLHHPGYAPAAAAATFVEPGEMVLAIQVRGEAVAYPVRQVAYHHVVEDVVGGTPLAVTY